MGGLRAEPVGEWLYHGRDMLFGTAERMNFKRAQEAEDTTTPSDWILRFHSTLRP